MVRDCKFLNGSGCYHWKSKPYRKLCSVSRSSLGAQVMFTSGFRWNWWSCFPSQWTVYLSGRLLCSWYLEWVRCASAPTICTCVHLTSTEFDNGLRGFLFQNWLGIMESRMQTKITWVSKIRWVRILFTHFCHWYPFLQSALRQRKHRLDSSWSNTLFVLT